MFEVTEKILHLGYIRRNNAEVDQMTSHYAPVFIL